MVMLIDVFLVCETKFTFGKWQVHGDLHCREEERSLGWENSTFGGSPQAVPNSDHMGPGALEKLGSPGPTSNVSFVLMYDF